jgi:4-amino-4-deoxy-L-arabinose transferase-like glycosyltransferase
VSVAVAVSTSSALSSRIRSRTTVVLTILLFVLAALPRIMAVSTAPMQADEKHWVLRSDLLYKRLVRLSPNYSTHLGHPGVFPAAVLMSGQVAAKVYRKVSLLVSDSARPVTVLTTARLANAVFSSLLPSLLFLLLIPWTSRAIAFSIGTLLAFGPRNIDLSAMAHIDTIFGVVTTLTIITYLSALRWRNERLKILCGVLFGLGILSKPTCVSLIPAFALAKTILRWRWPENYKEAPVTWSDVWVVLIGLSVFVAGYTRLWHHHRPYPQWEGIDRTIPEYLYSVGMNLRSGLPLCVLIVVLALSALVVGRKIMRGARLQWVDHLLAIGGAIAFAWTVMPAAFENLTLYYMRVFALTGVSHRSFHGTVPPVPGGYLTIALVDLPPLIVISALLTPLLLIPRIRRMLTESEQQLWVMACCTALVWILFLSTSSKQAWRYAVPVAPQIYIIASFTLCALGRAIDTPRLPIALLLLGQAKALYRGYPNWDLYQSPLAPPAQLAYEIGVFHPRAPQVDALRFLGERQQTSGKKVHVTVFGDGKTLTAESERWLGESASHIKLGYFREATADYVLVQGNIKVIDVHFQKYLTHEPVYVARAKGVPVISIYKIAPSIGSEAMDVVQPSKMDEHSNLDTQAPDLE